MSTVIVNEVRRGFYLDSVALMQLSANLAALPGVEDAVAMIGIAHREPGVGQVGAGIVSAPLACFEQALVGFVARLDAP